MYQHHDQRFSLNVARERFGSKHSPGAIIHKHSPQRESAGIPANKHWHSYRSAILLAYYRRDFKAARRLLWIWWWQHPKDLSVLKCAIIALLPARWIRWPGVSVPVPVASQRQAETELSKMVPK